MQITRLFTLFILLTIGLTLLAPNVLAQQDVSAPTRLALEVTYYPGRNPTYITVPGPEAKPSGSWFGMFAHTSSWQAPAGGPPMEAVRVVSKVEGDGVRVIVSRLSGNSLENEQRVGTYLIRETEKIGIDELKSFGIEPFLVKLVRVSPNVPPVPPVILKGVEAVVVINAMPKETTLPSYRIILRNQSNKNIVALGVDVVADGKIAITATPRGIDGQPLIPVGKEYWLTVSAPNRAQPVTGGYVPTSPSDQQILIKSVVFDDGTYEGDKSTVLLVTEWRTGEKMELPKLISLLGNALNSPVTDLTEGLRNLESQVSSIGSGTELQMVKALLLKDIHMLQNEEPQKVNVDLYRTWLTKTKERYELWLSRL